jgi:prolyl-tRNA synthetase
MLQSRLFPETKKEAPRDAVSINHKLLVRAGFIDQLMAGSWTLLPMGQRVVSKVNNIIREELNKIGCQEILMPLLHPKNIWNETGRWDSAREVMYQFEDSRGREYALSFTHEEIFLDLTRKFVRSYQDLPIALYHFSTKFRNEPRARSGILRGREFLMKDLYSIHRDENDFWSFYELVKGAYSEIFRRIGFNFRIIEAGGGVFTQNKTHEFQVISDGGEDLIYYCNSCDWGQNQEIFDGKVGDVCPKCGKGEIVSSKSIEVGNIFPFGTYYSELMRIYFTDSDGSKKPPFFGSYGIGTTRIIGAWAEVSHDDKGIIWSRAIAPFDVHLLELGHGGSTRKKAQDVYKKLTKLGVDVLWDDRDLSAGEKFADSDLIGIPIRLVVSDGKNDLEYKERESEVTHRLTFEGLINMFDGK